MSTAQPDKLILYTGYNAFKNNDKYQGTISFPTSVAAGSVGTVTKSFMLPDPPVFTEFFANFKEIADAIFSTGSARWYNSNVSGEYGVAIHVNAPSSNAGYIGGALFTEINGNTVTVTAQVINPYSSTISIDALSVDFVFIDYTLAN